MSKVITTGMFVRVIHGPFTGQTGSIVAMQHAQGEMTVTVKPAPREPVFFVRLADIAETSTQAEFDVIFVGMVAKLTDTYAIASVLDSLYDTA